MNIIQRIKCFIGKHKKQNDDPRWPIYSWCINCNAKFEDKSWMRDICYVERDRRRNDATYKWNPIERNLPGYINNWYDDFLMSKEEKDKAADEAYNYYKGNLSEE